MACAIAFFRTRIKRIEQIFRLAPLCFDNCYSCYSCYSCSKYKTNGVSLKIIRTEFSSIRRVRYIKHFYFLFEHELNESNKSFGLRPCVLTTTIRVIRDIIRTEFSSTRRVRYIKHFFLLNTNQTNRTKRSSTAEGKVHFRLRH